MMIRQLFAFSLFAIAAASFIGCTPKADTTVIAQPETSEADAAAYEAEMNAPTQYEK